MLSVLLILIIIACCLLVVIILAQNPKGGGLSNIGAGASQFLGARQTADFLEKSTWYFGIGIFVIVVFTYFLTSSPASGTKGVKSKTEGVDWTAPVAPKKAQPKPGAQPDQNGNVIQQGPPGSTPPPPPAPPK